MIDRRHITFATTSGRRQAVGALSYGSLPLLGLVFAFLGCGSGVYDAAVTTTVQAASTSTPLLASTAPATGAALTPGPIPFPTSFMRSVKDYGAMGDGLTDDTAAIQAALADGRSNTTASYYGAPKGLYFPAGTYLVSNSLVWNGCCVTLQGDGSSTSVIRLAPSAAGFGTAATPQAVLVTPAGNTSFRQNIWDLGISVGPGNPGAVAIDYVSNNTGSIRDVNITSEDGAGVAGIALTRHYPGPLLIKNVAVTGFQYGLKSAAYEYGPTLEGITLANQSVAGIYNQQQTMSVRNLASTNQVPAIINNGGMVLVLDAKLTGGAPTGPAVANFGSLYARSVQSSGYSSTLLDSSTTVPHTVAGTVSEYVAGAPMTLRGGTHAASLNLPVAETPTYQDASLTEWAQFKPAWYGDTKTLQALMNSGASTIYFPFAAYFSYSEAVISVPDTVKRIIGFSSIVNGSTAGTNGGGIRFVVNSKSTQPLIVEQFGYGIKVEHHGTRPVALKSGSYNYFSYPGAGSLYLEDVITSQLAVQAGQQVWARQLNNEISGTKITNSGSLWIFGLKTENAGIVVDTAATGKTEVLGNLIYPAQGVPSNGILFRSASRATSYIYSQSSYCPTCGYPIQVSEIMNGVTMEVTANPAQRYVMSLYHGQ